MRLGFISAHPCCCDCQTPFNFQRARSRLHFSFKCWKCGTNNNLLKGTALENVKKIRLFFMVTIAWFSNGKTTTLLGQTKIDHRTLADCRGRLQSVVDGTLQRLDQDDELMLGGDRVIVEVDECKLYSPKYHRGTPPSSNKLWVVGVIKPDGHNGRRSAFMLTEKRGADVLVPFIRRWVRPGSILISDCWAGYTSELDVLYLRERVNHSDEFAHYCRGGRLGVEREHLPY